MKYEWRKKEKDIYLPGNRPEKVVVPVYKFFSINGKGNPNDSCFGSYIEALYTISYAVRMSYKEEYQPDDFYEYTVYPLEGVWDINEEAKKEFTGVIDKEKLVFDLMIRQPDFVNAEFAQEALSRTIKKKKNELLKRAIFSEYEEGMCVQMMHLGSYDSEAETFREMELFCKEQKLVRKSGKHREIYISDPGKVPPEKLKTVLRFQVEKT